MCAVTQPVKIRMSLSCRQQGEAGAVWPWSHWRGWGAHQSWPLLGLVVSVLASSLTELAACCEGHSAWLATTRRHLACEDIAQTESGREGECCCLFQGTGWHVSGQNLLLFVENNCPVCVPLPWMLEKFSVPFPAEHSEPSAKQRLSFPLGRENKLVVCRSPVLLMNLHRVKRKWGSASCHSAPAPQFKFLNS